MFIPVLGVLVSAVAIALGVMGLRAVKAQPQLRGTAHAWVAVILGSLTTLANLAITTALVIARTR